MVGSYPLIAVIDTFFACVGSLWLAGEFGIVSVIYGILKSSSSCKLKPNFLPDGVYSISYGEIVVSQNGVDLRSSSHGINLSRSELWIWL